MPFLLSLSRTTFSLRLTTTTRTTTIGASQGATYWVPPNVEYKTNPPSRSRRTVYLLWALTAPQGSISFNAIYKKHGKQTFQRSHSLYHWPRHQLWSSARIPPPLVRNSREVLCELIPFSRGMRGTLWHSERGLGGTYRRLVADMHVGWEIVIAECEVSDLEDTF